MDDYISWKDAVEWFMAFIHMDENAISADTVVTDLKNAIPAADVEPVRHEMWEEYSTSRFYGFDKSGDPIYMDGAVYYCSNPRCRRKTIIKEKYCPNCGAKMDGWRRLYEAT